jgi:hypothetical protein
MLEGDVDGEKDAKEKEKRRRKVQEREAALPISSHVMS